MNNKELKSEKEKFDFIITEMKYQSNLIKHLISEINQLKQILILSKNTLPNTGPSPQSAYNPNNSLLTIDKPLQKPPKITNEEALSYPSSNISFPLEEVLSNLTDSNKDLIIEVWKKCQDEYKIIIEAKKDDNHELFIKTTFNMFLFIFNIMIIILKFEEDKFITADQSLTAIAKNLGPLPILLDFDLVDFINEQKKNENYSIGKKTINGLFAKIEKTIDSLGELLNIILI